MHCILEPMNFLKNKQIQHVGFWILIWLIQSVLFSGGKDISFYLVKNIAIVSLQMLVVYFNLYLSSTLLSKKSFFSYALISVVIVYLVFTVSSSLIDLVTTLFFPSLVKITLGNQSLWPTGFWRIISGSAPYSLALLSSTIFYLLSSGKDRNESIKATHAEDTPTEDDGFILIKEGKTLHRINTADVLYVEGLKEYVNWHTAGKRLITLHSLQKLEDLLGSKGFLRTHKSFIVNTNCIDTIKSTSVEISGKKIPIGRSYREKVQRHFNFEQTPS